MPYGTAISRTGKSIRSLALPRPGVAQRHRPVEYRGAGLRVLQVGYEVAVPLELEAIPALRVPQCRLEAGRDPPHRIRIDVLEEITLHAGLRHAEQAVV